MIEGCKRSTGFLVWGLVTLVLVVLAACYGIVLGNQHSVLPASPKIHSLAPAVIQLEKLGELAAIRIHVTDVLWAEGDGYRGTWLINGDAMLACDVSQAELENIDSERKTATIYLPRPRLISARVNHEKTKTWSMEKTTWLPWRWGDEGVMRSAAMLHAQRLIESAAGTEANRASATAQTERVIHQIYDTIGWKVIVRWK